MALSRLDKLLGDSGRASRSEARALIRAGRVTVNGRVAADGGEKYDPAADVICLDGEALNCSPFRSFVLHKPAGVLSATEDPSLPTVLDLLPPELRRLGLFPVGRLDRDVTGLLVLTNDGDLAHAVISPKKHVPKRYLARLDGPVGPADIAAFAAGLTLEDGTLCRPALLVPEAEDPCRCRVTVYEGRFHQVKRMFLCRGRRVLRLCRERVGGLELPPELEPGQFRELSGEELALLTANQ